MLNNGGRYRYDSLQMEARKQFSTDLGFQVNYTFQKTLTDANGTAQNLFDSFLDIENRRLEYTRADYDTNHIFNASFICSMPFGRGKPLAKGIHERI